MASHDIAVLSGEIGSTTRSKKINNMLNILDKAVSQAREANKPKIKIGSGYLATELNYSQSTICRNGYPEFFTRYFDSVQFRNNKGLYIEVEEFVEERKDQREKLAEKNKEDKTE